MKKIFLILLIVLVAALCASLIGCGLFGKPNGPDGPDNPNGTDKVYNLSKLQIALEEFSYVYDGNAHTPTVYLSDGNVQVAEVGANKPHGELNVAYADNVEIGQASVTVSAKNGAKRFVGSATVYYKITANNARTEVSDYTSLKDCIERSYGNLVLSADVEIPQDESLTIPKNVTLDVNTRKLINRGELILKGQLQIGGDGMWGDDVYDLVNYGKLATEQGSKIIFKSFGNVVNHGQFVHNGEFAKHKDNYRDNYVYSDSDLNFSSSQYAKVYVRVPFAEADVSLAENTFSYGEKVSLLLDKSDRDVDYTVTYESNVNAGKYDVTFTATEHSRYFYGERTFEYEITRIAYDAQDSDAFLNALQNANYSPVSFQPKLLSFMTDVRVLPNVTVNVSNCSIANLSLAENALFNADDAYLRAVSVEKGAELNVSDAVVVYNRIDGQGAVNVLPTGELYFGSEASKPDLQINNSGSVYADFDLSGVSGSGVKTVRRQLSGSEITADNLDYTGENLQASPVFEHSDEQNYNLYYFIDGEYTSLKSPKERGVYQAEVRFSDKNKHYCGSTAFSFEVVRGKITVTNTTSLTNALNDDNYDRYEIANWQIDSSFTLPAGKAVIAQNVVNKSELTVLGTLSVTSFTNSSESSLTVSGSGLLKLSGDFYNTDETSVLSLESGANYRNVGSGAAYLSRDGNDLITGLKYVRTESISAAEFQNVSQAVYKLNTKPTFELVYNSAVISADDYSVNYVGNFERTEENGAQIVVTAAPDSKVYYGKAICPFTVLGGSVTVNSQSELAVALNNVAQNTELCNWATVTTGKAFTIKFNGNNALLNNFRVRNGTTLEVKHNVEFDDLIFDKTKYVLQNDGVIEIHGAAQLERARLWQDNGTGVFKLFASDAAHLKNYALSANYDYIRLDGDVYLESGDTLTVYSAVNGSTFDLNGHTVKGINATLTIATRGKTLTILRGIIQPTLKLSVGNKHDEADGVGRVILQNVTHSTVDNGDGIPVEE